MAKEEGPSRRLPLRSVYYRDKEVVKQNRAGAAIRAVSRATEHMRRNDYEATVCEVYDMRNGKLHAVMRNSVNGNTTILYEAPYNPKEER
jgi:hypothetical protein